MAAGLHVLRDAGCMCDHTRNQDMSAITCSCKGCAIRVICYSSTRRVPYRVLEYSPRVSNVLTVFLAFGSENVFILILNVKSFYANIFFVISEVVMCSL